MVQCCRSRSLCVGVCLCLFVCVSQCTSVSVCVCVLVSKGASVWYIHIFIY